MDHSVEQVGVSEEPNRGRVEVCRQQGQEENQRGEKDSYHSRRRLSGGETGQQGGC